MCFIKKGTNGRTLAPLAADWCRSLGVAYTINLSPPPTPHLSSLSGKRTPSSARADVLTSGGQRKSEEMNPF